MLHFWARAGPVPENCPVFFLGGRGVRSLGANAYLSIPPTGGAGTSGLNMLAEIQGTP
jgi:hypothetical protein